LKFNPPPAEIVSRLTQRSDDTEEKLTVRLKAFHEQSAPIINHYEKNTGVPVLKIDGSRPTKDVFQIIKNKLSE
jgi:adenylate kinase